MRERERERERERANVTKNSWQRQCGQEVPRPC